MNDAEWYRSHPWQPVAWMEQAECVGLDIMVPDTAEQSKQAQAVCVECPVRSECMEYALADPGLVGIWGGMTSRERRQERQRRDVKPSQRKPIKHGTDGGYHAHRRHGVLPVCPECSRAHADAVAEHKATKEAA